MNTGFFINHSKTINNRNFCSVFFFKKNLWKKFELNILLKK